MSKSSLVKFIIGVIIVGTFLFLKHRSRIFDLREIEVPSYSQKVHVQTMDLSAEDAEATDDTGSSTGMPQENAKGKNYVAIVESYFNEAKKALKEDRFKHFLASRNKRENWILDELDLLIEFRGELMLNYDNVEGIFLDPEVYRPLQQKVVSVIRLWGRYIERGYSEYVVNYFLSRSEYNHAFSEFYALLHFFDLDYPLEGRLQDVNNPPFLDPILALGHRLGIKIWRKRGDKSQVAIPLYGRESLEHSLETMGKEIAIMWDALRNSPPIARNQVSNVKRWSYKVAEHIDEEIESMIDRVFHKDYMETDHIIR